MTRPKSQTKALGDLVNALVPHSGVVTGGGKPAEFAEELAQSPVRPGADPAPRAGQALSARCLVCP
jgi:hypothetical protein